MSVLGSGNSRVAQRTTKGCTILHDLREEHVEYLDFRPVAETLARTYVKENIVDENSIDDCRHIALTSIYRANVLVSWNFKHIVNSSRIEGYNSGI